MRPPTLTARRSVSVAVSMASNAGEEATPLCEASAGKSRGDGEGMEEV